MKLSLSLFFLLIFNQLYAQKASISGYVKDAKTGEELIGAAVYFPELKNGAVTNVYGYYSFAVTPGKYIVATSYIGYKTKVDTLDINTKITFNISLEIEEQTLDVITINGEADDQNVNNVEMSVAKLEIATVKKLPALLGEVDIIRTITSLPGVSTVGEGASGFNVRGGGVDQNLILLDEAPVFNSSHLFGFFSIFNADAVKDVKLYKGGIPAYYGGRLSSVLDIREKEGNMKKTVVSGGLGIVSSRLMIETPIIKDKSSFLISARRSYADLFLKLSNNEGLRQSRAYFYDLNAKVNYIINDKNRLFLSGYFGRDVFKFRDFFGFDWGNATGTFRWNKIYSDNLFSNITISYSDYQYKLDIGGVRSGFEWSSSIRNLQIKNDYTLYASNKHTVEYGAGATLYNFQPGKVQSVNFAPIALEIERAIEPFAYVSDEFKVSDKLLLYGGLRYTWFGSFGNAKSYVYAENAPRVKENIVDTLFFESGELMKSYGGIEPRFSAKMSIDQTSSIKMSYNRMRQYLHLISNTTSPTPIDVWKPSGRHIAPQIADQIALGYFRNLKENTIEASVELYYKEMRNLVDYKNGAELLLNETLETELISGFGRAYGAEFYLKKNTGKLTGWLSYTLSKSEIQVKGEHPDEVINNGEFYAANFDQRHRITAVATYQLTDRISASLNFTYNTGRPFTTPDSKYYYAGIAVPNYSSRNNDRIPDFHRLDFSLNIEPRKELSKKIQGTWNFSLYNVYGRKNAFSIYANQDNSTSPPTTAYYKLSILGIVVPSVTYNFNF